MPTAKVPGCKRESYNSQGIIKRVVGVSAHRVPFLSELSDAGQIKGSGSNKQQLQDSDVNSSITCCGEPLIHPKMYVGLLAPTCDGMPRSQRARLPVLTVTASTRANHLGAVGSAPTQCRRPSTKPGCGRCRRTAPGVRTEGGCAVFIGTAGRCRRRSLGRCESWSPAIRRSPIAAARCAPLQVLQRENRLPDLAPAPLHNGRAVRKFRYRGRPDEESSVQACFHSSRARTAGVGHHRPGATHAFRRLSQLPKAKSTGVVDSRCARQVRYQLDESMNARLMALSKECRPICGLG